MKRRKTIYDYLSIIEAISVQEYYRIQDPSVPYSAVVRLAALAVRVAILSGHLLNTNLLSCLIRKTIRQELAAYY